MKIIFLGLIILLTANVEAQDLKSSEPIVRPRNSEESSSFMGDPDPLDPLPVKKENLKDDEEPVLNDIRQILNAPTKKKTVLKKNQPIKKTNSKSGSKPVSKNVSKAARKSKVKLSKKVNLILDEPDFKLEKKLNQIYKQFNAEPTSAEMWSTKTADRDADTYTIQKGDTLSSISRTLFGDPTFWPKIWSINSKEIKNPHFIYPGAKVSFFPGDGLDTPTVAVGNDSKIPSEETKVVENPTDSGTKDVPVASIPDSIPLYRNDAYFLNSKILEVDLKKLPEVADDFSNDILLSDKKIVSDVNLEQDQIIKGYCGGEQLIHVNLKSTEGELHIYETLETLDTDAGDIFSYRFVGKAKIINSNRIKITQCSGVTSKDLVFISPSEVNQYRSNQVSKQTTPTLIGGPGLGTQKIFSNQQKAYINLGSQQAEIGQVLNIKSQLTEKRSGQIRIIDKFGSFAIGIVTETSWNAVTITWDNGHVATVHHGDMREIQRAK